MGKIKEISLDLILSIILVSIGFALRYFVYTFYKYPMDIDTYYFLRIIRDHIPGTSFMFTVNEVMIFYMVISLLSIFFFYQMCRLYTLRFSSFVATLFFALSPLLFFNNKFSFIDKNAPSILMIIFFLTTFKVYKGMARVLLVTGILFMFAWIWEGWVYLIPIIIIYLIIYLMYNKIKYGNHLIILCLLGITGIVVYYFNRILVLINNRDRMLISELNPIWNVGVFAEYLIIVLVFLYVFTKIRIDKVDKNKINEYLFLYVFFIITFFSMCFMFRLNIFLLPILYLWFAIMIEDMEYKTWIKVIVLIFIGLFVFGTSWKIYMQPPLMNDGIKDAMDYINTLPTDCVIGVWSLGHIYQYYTNKTVMYKATAAGYNEQIDYLIRGNTTNCTLIYSEEDIKALEYMMKYDKINISKENYYISKDLPKKLFSYRNNNYTVI